MIAHAMGVGRSYWLEVFGDTLLLIGYGPTLTF